MIKRHPEWDMQDRLLLECIDYDNATCNISGKPYEMKSCCFPTVNPNAPYELTPDEIILMSKLHHSLLLTRSFISI